MNLTTDELRQLAELFSLPDAIADPNINAATYTETELDEMRRWSA